VDALAALWVKNRDDLRRVNPSRHAHPLTLEVALQNARGAATADVDNRRDYVIMRDGQIAGDLGISGIIRWPMHCANVGLFVDAELRGEGIGRAAIDLACELAFGELELHRLEAGAQPSNVASLGMLRRARFTEIGLAPRFLFVDGAWRDHILFQKLAPNSERAAG